MIDRSSIFSEIMRRNHQRISNGLPRIDVAKEYIFRVALAEENASRDRVPHLSRQYAADREMIQTQVIADVAAQHGALFIHTEDGHRTIGDETRQRFDLFLKDVEGFAAIEPVKSEGVPVSNVLPFVRRR